jgi:molybdopterin-binding protein
MVVDTTDTKLLPAPGDAVPTPHSLLVCLEKPAMKLSARNVLKGIVVKVVPGSVNSEVTLRVADSIDVVAIISKDSAEHLGLKEGSAAYAVIKASSVIVGVD